MCHWRGLSPKRGNKQAQKCVMYRVFNLKVDRILI
jgi:hypothetical protein